MILWIIFAFMAAGSAVFVLFALRPGRPASDRDNPDLLVYKDQLATLEREVESGRIEASEAQSAEIEISRRILAIRDPGSSGGKGVGASSSGAALPVGSAILVVMFALGIYLVNGSPDLPGTPYAERYDDNLQNESVTQLIARIESHLLEQPEDGRGWDLVAPVYLRLRRYEDAAQAFSNAGRILGPSATRFAGLGEALAGANGGVIIQRARNAFVAAVELDPTLIRPRFMLTIALEQDGKLREARASWQALVTENAADPPWVDAITQRITALDERIGSGPDQADVEAAQQMSPEGRQDMVIQMVGQLAAKLATDGNDLPGWLRLARSYIVLQQPDQARSAIDRARLQFVENDQALNQISEAARSLGLEE